jgi:pSer/pThr/pTyr-binding forkhead associated (FHA) protein
MDSSDRRTFRLVSRDGGPDVTIIGPAAVFGRHPDCDVWLDALVVSRRHCFLATSEGRLTVRDLGSRNGTLVNGRRVVRHDLAPGDELTIGTFRFVVTVGSDR